MTIYRPATAASAAPLVALSAVVMDTETTGLDVSKARIVQIGGVSTPKELRNRGYGGEQTEQITNRSIHYQFGRSRRRGRSLISGISSSGMSMTLSSAPSAKLLML